VLYPQNGDHIVTIDQSCPWVHFVHLVLRQLGPVTYEIQRNESAGSWIVHVDKLKPCHDPEEQKLDSQLPVNAPQITSAVSFANHNASGTESHAPCIYVLFY